MSPASRRCGGRRPPRREATRSERDRVGVVGIVAGPPAVAPAALSSRAQRRQLRIARAPAAMPATGSPARDVGRERGGREVGGMVGRAQRHRQLAALAGEHVQHRTRAVAGGLPGEAAHVAVQADVVVRTSGAGGAIGREQRGLGRRDDGVAAGRRRASSEASSRATPCQVERRNSRCLGAMVREHADPGFEGSRRGRRARRGLGWCQLADAEVRAAARAGTASTEVPGGCCGAEVGGEHQHMRGARARPACPSSTSCRPSR